MRGRARSSATQSALAGAILVMTSACGTPTPDADERAAASAAIDPVLESVGVGLGDDDRSCVVDDVAVAARDADVTGTVIAEALVECLGRPAVAASVLGSAGDLDADAARCAADELDEEFVVEVVAARLDQREVASVRVELAVTRALGLCLPIEELVEGSGG